MNHRVEQKRGSDTLRIDLKSLPDAHPRFYGCFTLKPGSADKSG